MKRPIYLLTGFALAILSAALLLFGLTAAPAAAYQPAEPAQAAANWLVTTHQNDDGGYTSFSAGANQGASDVGGTVDALLALAAAGADTTETLAFLENDQEAAAAYAAQYGGPAAKLILALTAAGSDPRDIGGYNIVISLTNYLSPTGQYNVTTAFDQSLAILALSAAGEPIPVEAVDWLLDLQTAGSWDDGFGTLGNPDATAMAVMALLASGLTADEAPVAAARDFLAEAQLPTGGWAYGPDLPESANSTALVIQALRALGEDFTSAGNDWEQDGITPLAALLAWQSETGAFQADFGSGRFDDFFTTVQAIPAVAVLEIVPIAAETATTEPPTEEPATATAEPATAEPTDEPTAEPTAEPTDTPVEEVQPTAEPQATATTPAATAADGGGSFTAWIVGFLIIVAGFSAIGWLRQRK